MLTFAQSLLSATTAPKPTFTKVGMELVLRPGCISLENVSDPRLLRVCVLEPRGAWPSAWDAGPRAWFVPVKWSHCSVVARGRHQAAGDGRGKPAWGNGSGAGSEPGTRVILHGTRGPLPRRSLGTRGQLSVCEARVMA